MLRDNFVLGLMITPHLTTQCVAPHCHAQALERLAHIEHTRTQQQAAAAQQQASVVAEYKRMYEAGAEQFMLAEARWRLAQAELQESVGLCSVLGCGYSRNDAIVKLGCGHSSCKGCIRRYAKAENSNCKVPKCPSCNVVIPNDDLAKVDKATPKSASDGVSNCLRAKLNMQLLANGLVFRCKNGCDALISISAGGAPDGLGGHSLTICQACWAPHCVSCQELATHGICDPLPQQTREATTRMSLAVGNIKICPTCAIPIEKTEGCNVMQCGGCNHVFCWLCGVVTGTPEDDRLGFRTILTHDHHSNYCRINQGPSRDALQQRWQQCRMPQCVGKMTGKLDDGFDEYRHPSLQRMLKIMFRVPEPLEPPVE